MKGNEFQRKESDGEGGVLHCLLLCLGIAWTNGDLLLLELPKVVTPVCILIAFICLMSWYRFMKYTKNKGKRFIAWVGGWGVGGLRTQATPLHTSEIFRLDTWNIF